MQAYQEEEVEIEGAAALGKGIRKVREPKQRLEKSRDSKKPRDAAKIVRVFCACLQRQLQVTLEEFKLTSLDHILLLWRQTDTRTDLGCVFTATAASPAAETRSCSAGGAGGRADMAGQFGGQWLLWGALSQVRLTA